MQVPTYGGPQVERAVTRQAPVSAPGDFGVAARQTTALGQAMGQAADDLDRLAIQQANEATFAAEAQARRDWIGYSAELQKSRQGANAKGVTADVEKWWADNGQRYLEGKDGRTKRMVQQSLGRMQAAAMGDFKNFELRQGEIAADAALDANVKSAISAIAANPSVDNIALNRAGMTAALRQHGAARGWAPEVLNDKIATAESASTIAAFNTLLARSPKAAQEFWAANRETVRGEMRDEIDNRLKTAVAGIEGTEAVTEVWRAMGPKNDMAPVETDKMAESLREKFKDQPETLKAALQSLRERAVEHNASQAERAAGYTNDVMAVWNSTKNLSAVKRTPAWSSLPATKQAQIEEHILSAQTSALNRSNAALNRDVLMEQRNQQRLRQQGFAAYLQYSDPQVLAGMSESQVQALLPSLGNELTDHLVQKRRAMASSEASRTASIDKNDFDQIAQEMKLRPFENGKSEDDKAALGALQYRVEQLIDHAQRQKKAPLDRAEKQQLMRQEIAKQVLVSNWWGGTSSKPVISLTPAEVAKVVVPQADRLAITAAMQTMYERTKRAEFAPSEENMKRFYLLHKTPAAALIPNGQ